METGKNNRMPIRGIAERARTVTFMGLIGAQLAHAFNCRNDRLSLFKIGIMTNKPLLWAVGGSTLLQVGLVLNPWTREVFKLSSFNPEHWIMAFGVGSLMLVAMELWKAAQTGGIALKPHQGIKGRG
jgi:Ca2+-transporting ATPase